MMNTPNKILPTILVACGLTITTSAQAQEWFVKPYVGLSQMSDTSGTAQNVNLQSGTADIDLDTGFVAGLSGGYRYQQLAVELGWEYRSNDSTTTISETNTYPEGNYASSTFFVNGLYYFTVNDTWQPYVGAGIIWGQEMDIDLELAGNELSYSQSGDIGYQLIGGIEYRLNKQWSIQTEVRYSSLSDIDLTSEGSPATGSIDGLDYHPLTLQAGIRYQF